MGIKLNIYENRVYVRVYISSEKLGESLIPINFLLDTGADVTTISPVDASENNIDFSRLEKTKNPSFGVGGEQKGEYEIKNVIIKFPLENGIFHYIQIEKISIIKPDKDRNSHIGIIPSLMGIDILKSLKFTYNSHSKLELKEEK